MILGCAGTGKTTFARLLAEKLNSPVIVLDELWPQPLKPEDVPAFQELLKKAHEGEKWVSDGNFAAASFSVRLPLATQIIWLEAPVWVCILRACRRAFGSDGHHQLKDLPKVISYIRGFNRKNRPLIEEQIRLHGANVPVIHVSDAKVFLGQFN